MHSTTLKGGPGPVPRDGAGAQQGEITALLPDPERGRRAAVGFDLATLGRITGMALRYRWRMAVAVVATALAATAQIVIPRLIGSAVDQTTGLLAGAGATEAAAHAALVHTAWLLLGAAAFRGVCTMGQNYLGESVGHHIAHDLRLAYYARLQRLSFSYHDHVHTGELMTRGILDIEGARMWVSTGVLRLVLLTVLLAGGTWMLLGVDVPLALLALSFVPLVGIGATIGRLKLRALWYRLQEELGILTRIMEENLGGIRVVRAFAARTFEMTRFDVVSKRALAILHRRIAIFVASTTTMTFVFFLSMGLVLWVGGYRVIDGEVTLGELTATLAFMTILQQPVRQIAWLVNSIARTSTCGARLFEILDLEPDIRDRPDAKPLEVSDCELRFEDVSFSYHKDGEAPPTLEHVSFELRAGEVVGIVGPPGSGKSTIAHLIPRFYDVSGGRITIDGVDIRDVTLESLRRHVTVVQQDTFLFTSAVDTNVAYGDPWADRSAIRQSTEVAQLHNYIAHLPEGYETLVGERGVSLSGGQRQRLSIARGVLPESRVIVFDDSTAAVDAATERRIREALSELTKTRATIIIAHRLSSLMHADRILFLERGRIVESGTHDELIALGG
ncbi:MAG: ABC transporter ATP-binding protein, partial [Gammaproteobacteria bacterium]|nr:ABC transporter ATP-binding protein [Gammaproteobacteria bacterium]